MQRRTAPFGFGLGMAEDFHMYEYMVKAGANVMSRIQV
jgi:hypothetical protein